MDVPEDEARQRFQPHGPEDQRLGDPAGTAPPEQDREDQAQRELQRPDEVTVTLAVILAERTAEDPVAEAPELAAGVFVVQDEIKGQVQEPARSEGVENRPPAPERQSQQPPGEGRNCRRQKPPASRPRSKVGQRRVRAGWPMPRWKRRRAGRARGQEGANQGPPPSRYV